MTTLDQIRAKLDTAHPVVNRNVDGVDIPFTKEEREAWLDEQARLAFADEAGWERLRRERDSLLSGSDWTQVADSQVDMKAWAKYRQALRDLPANTEHPSVVKWPTPPE